MSLFSPTATRVERRMPKRAAKVKAEMEECVQHVVAEGQPAIQRRMRKLEEEWDIDRAFQTWAGVACVAGGVLALTVRRPFAAIPIAVGAALLANVAVGWAPPLAVLRMLGFRTQREIGVERAELQQA